MYIFYKKMIGGWRGGMILVAANDENEAERIISESDGYIQEYINGRNEASWQKIEGACIDCSIPHIIDECSYTE